MAESNPVEMTDEERDDFLANGGTGVISLSTKAEESPYTIPVSYGYDARHSTFYFRLAVGPESGKGELADRPVSFVTYGQDGEEWHSVVASGHLESTTDESIATETLDGLDWVHIPLVDIFGRPTDEVDFEFYRLVPNELDGRKEQPTEI